MNEGINLCFIDMMHQCSFKHWDQQKHCAFREKNSYLESCRHCQSETFCQNLEAYPTAKTVRVKAEDLPKIIERGEEIWGDSVVVNPGPYIRDIWQQQKNEESRNLLEKVIEAGRVLDRADVPIKERMIHPGFDCQYEYRQFIQAVIHYAVCSIEEADLGHMIQFSDHSDQYDVSRGRHGVIHFKFTANDGGYIFSQLEVGRDLSDKTAKRYGRIVGGGIMREFRHIQNKKSLMTVSPGPPSMIAKGPKW